MQESTTRGELGRSFWRAFMKRNKNKIETKKSRRYASYRNDWTTYRNISAMYDALYAIMVEDAKIAERVEPYWGDRFGDPDMPTDFGGQ